MKPPSNLTPLDTSFDTCQNGCGKLDGPEHIAFAGCPGIGTQFSGRGRWAVDQFGTDHHFIFDTCQLRCGGCGRESACLPPVQAMRIGRVCGRR